MSMWTDVTLACGTVLQVTDEVRPSGGRYYVGSHADARDMLAIHERMVRSTGCCRRRCDVVGVGPAQKPTPSLPEVGSVWRHECGAERVCVSVMHRSGDEGGAWHIELKPTGPRFGVARHFNEGACTCQHYQSVQSLTAPLIGLYNCGWTPVERPVEAACPGCRCLHLDDCRCEHSCGMRPAPSPPPPEPDEWHGWQVSDLRMERDRVIQRFTAQRRVLRDLDDQVNDAALTLEQIKMELDTLDRAIERRKAKP
jgi:hypothetical protein